MTDKTGWTPGKWFVSGVRGKIDREEYHAVNVENGGVQIAIVWYDPKSHEGYADAHLIAAAPELYEALDALDKYGHTEAIWHRAKAALAKARGEKP